VQLGQSEAHQPAAGAQLQPKMQNFVKLVADVAVMLMMVFRTEHTEPDMLLWTLTVILS
jgi:hypothetical protein